MLERLTLSFSYESNLDTRDPCEPYKMRYEHMIEAEAEREARAEKIREAERAGMSLL